MSDVVDVVTARRLDDDELDVWYPFIRLVQLLPQALDRTLRDEAGVNHAHYAILVTLATAARADEPAPPMRELARIAGLSPSRLSHAIDALEARGWVRRVACATDRRVQRPELTEAGRAALRDAAPAHVAQIRSLLAVLDDDERAQLRRLAAKLLIAVEEPLVTTGR